MVNIQTQPNGCDCGVFAIKNATELAFGKDPLLCRYDTEVMQKHFLQCLENRKTNVFLLNNLGKSLLGTIWKVLTKWKSTAFATCQTILRKQWYTVIGVESAFIMNAWNWLYRWESKNIDGTAISADEYDEHYEHW